MEGDDKIGALRQLLNERCSGSEFRDDDLKNLVDARYETEADLKAATMKSLTNTLPGRYDVAFLRRKKELLREKDEQVRLEQGGRIEKTMEEIQIQLAELKTAMAAKKSIRISDANSTLWKDV